MAISIINKNGWVTAVKEVTLPTASGTVEGPGVPAGAIVFNAWAEVTEAVDGSSAHAFDLAVGGTDIMTALNVQAASLGDILTEAPQAQFAIAADDTLDVVSTVTGTGTAGKVAVGVVYIDTANFTPADEVVRDQLG